jgi:hypothetical protein
MMRKRRLMPIAIGVGMTSSLLAYALSACHLPSNGWVATKNRSTHDQYVNCVAGKDSNSGLRRSPLRTITAATAHPRPAGTTIYLARGCTWNGSVVLRGSGSSTMPITLSAYGTGAAPAITGRALPSQTPVLQLAGDFQLVSGVTVAHAAGIGILTTGARARIDGVEITDVGIGVRFAARFGAATSVNIHDLHMMVNTPGGDDDYGALGFDVESQDVEITRSRCTNCRASSYDYGHDGGFAEVWNYGDGLTVHDNVGRNTSGILEVGGTAHDASARGITITRNNFQEAHGGIWVHRADRFAIPAGDIVVSANTITNSRFDVEVLGGDLSVLTFQGNTVRTDGHVSRTGAPRRHSCNVYVLPDPKLVGFPLDRTERAGGATLLSQPRPAQC